MPSRLTVLLALIVAGCSAPAGSNYDAATGRTVYRSSSISLGQSASGGAVGKSQISLAAEASCMGEGCVPETYDLSLSKEGGTRAISDYNQISFETEEGSLSFGSGSQADGRARFFAVAQGEIVRVSVPTDIFASFAESSTLTIRLGGELYRLPYTSRGALRRALPPSDGGV